MAPHLYYSAGVTSRASGAILAIRGAMCNTTRCSLVRAREQVMDEEPSIPRRLAAILAADIAGYSRLMHEDASSVSENTARAVCAP